MTRHAEAGTAAWLEELSRVEPDALVRLSKPGPRYTSYPTAPEWSDEVGPDQLEERLERADAEGAHSPLSMYVHVPFCRNMCSYCGCNVVVARRQERADLYLDYLERELDLLCERLTSRRSLIQLHLGGGTPTYLNEAQLTRLWSLISDRFTPAEGAEIALEIDPVVTTTDQLDLLRGFGFNRVSMGIQDFTPEVQERVGRVQTVELTRALYQHARDLGFGGINFDLIFGLPRQRLDTFQATLDRVLEMGPDRVAVFGYAHVPWMKPNQRGFTEQELPDAVARFGLYMAALRGFLDAGYVQIGMDHFALPDDELARARLARRLHRNFQGYTVLPASDIIALGITGISEVQGLYAQNLKPLARYYRALEAGRLATERGCLLSDEDRLRRDVIHQIMCNFHVDLEQLCAPRGIDARAHFATELADLDACIAAGLARRDGATIEVTPLGRILVRNVAMVFDTYLRKRADARGTFSKTI